VSPIRFEGQKDARHYWLLYEGAAGKMIDAELRDDAGDAVMAKAIPARSSPHDNWLDWLMLGTKVGEPRVRVIVSPETEWLTAVALLRKIADWIEQEGLEDFSADPFLQDPPS